LGFLAVSVLPFLFYWAAVPKRFWRKLLVLALSCAIFYVLVLTSSRSAMIALVVLVLAISVFVRRRILFLVGTLGGGGFAATTLWSGDQVARFQGLLGGGGAGGATAQGRIDGILSDISVWMKAPVFGHGLGTSYEANSNFAGSAFVSHNLYTESLVTLGIIGAFIFFRFLYAMFNSAVRVYALTRRSSPGVDSSADSADPLVWLPKAMICLLAMYAVFGMSSYGVMEYYCYLFAGLCVVLNNLSGSASNAHPSPAGSAARPKRSPSHESSVARGPRANV
jgi:O-antigen ligase